MPRAGHLACQNCDKLCAHWSKNLPTHIWNQNLSSQLPRTQSYGSLIRCYGFLAEANVPLKIVISLLFAPRQDEMRRLQQEYTSAWQKVQLNSGEQGRAKGFPVLSKQNRSSALSSLGRGVYPLSRQKQMPAGLWQHLHRNPQPYPRADPVNSSAMFVKLDDLSHDFSIHPDWGLEKYMKTDP